MSFQKRKFYQTSEKSVVNEVISFPQTLTTYLGQKGYTILKNELSEQQITNLKIKKIRTRSTRSLKKE